MNHPVSTTFQTARELAGQRVAMCFIDGHEVIAVLLSATTDTDGSKHLIYDAVEWTNEAETYGGGRGTCYYADATSLVSIRPAGETLAGTA